jgi:hypothetical protein
LYGTQRYLLRLLRLLRLLHVDLHPFLWPL